jgi:FkbM family methyltransferase
MKYDDLVKKKTKFVYTDHDEFRHGQEFKDFGVSELMIRSAEQVTDAMVMCLCLDHKPAYLEYCRNFRVAVQAGGFNGLYPKVLGQMFETVYTFEPDSLNFHCLVNNCQSENIIKFNAVLGDDHRLVTIGRGLDVNPGMFTVMDDPGIIPQLLIDDLELPVCDLIQLDIEGREMNALIGARQTIDRYRPVVICEVVGSSDGGAAILSYLSQWGYEETKLLRYAGDKLYTCKGKEWTYYG